MLTVAEKRYKFCQRQMHVRYIDFTFVPQNSTCLNNIRKAAEATSDVRHER